MDNQPTPAAPDPDQAVATPTTDVAPPAPAQTDSGAAQPAPTKPADEKPTLTDLRKRGLVGNGKGVCTGSGDKLIPPRYVTGPETFAYITDRKDLLRVLDTGWYALGDPPAETE